MANYLEQPTFLIINNKHYRNYINQTYMRSILILTIFSLVLASCKKQGKKFFDYDEVDYYFVSLDDSKISKLFRNEYNSASDSLVAQVIAGGIPKSITDLSFIEMLEQWGYQKRKLSPSLFAALDAIFNEKEVDEYEISGCAPLYRDILIFRKAHNVTGVAKICQECGNNQIEGAKVDPQSFGQNGEYEKLELLLIPERGRKGQ